ncbi:uncharacterized protein LOC135809083 [Sycon ciliatum]|uniref:uncharacterized protein LOC135809083 n=1 Tax=Sycon ciliatum TaxID=27933 RepID=UPI0020AD810C|eukprot:scpid26422/ scgid34598/ Forkhead box protein J2
MRSLDLATGGREDDMLEKSVASPTQHNVNPNKPSMDNSLTNITWLGDVNLPSSLETVTSSTAGKCNPPSSPTADNNGRACTEALQQRRFSNISKPDVSGSDTAFSQLDDSSSAPTPPDTIECTCDDITDKENEEESRRPPYSYAALIAIAIHTSRDRTMSLTELYEWFEDNFTYYRSAKKGWKNSIRHNLTLRACFQRVPTPNGRGSRWTLKDCPQTEELLGMSKPQNGTGHPHTPLLDVDQSGSVQMVSSCPADSSDEQARSLYSSTVPQHADSCGVEPSPKRQCSVQQQRGQGSHAISSDSVFIGPIPCDLLSSFCPSQGLLRHLQAVSAQVVQSQIKEHLAPLHHFAPPGLHAFPSPVEEFDGPILPLPQTYSTAVATAGVGQGSGTTQRPQRLPAIQQFPGIRTRLGSSAPSGITVGSTPPNHCQPHLSVPSFTSAHPQFSNNMIQSHGTAIPAIASKTLCQFLQPPGNMMSTPVPQPTMANGSHRPSSSASNPSQYQMSALEMSQGLTTPAAADTPSDTLSPTTPESQPADPEAQIGETHPSGKISSRSQLGDITNTVAPSNAHGVQALKSNCDTPWTIGNGTVPNLPNGWSPTLAGMIPQSEAMTDLDMDLFDLRNYLFSPQVRADPSHQLSSPTFNKAAADSMDAAGDKSDMASAGNTAIGNQTPCGRPSFRMPARFLTPGMGSAPGPAGTDNFLGFSPSLLKPIYDQSGPISPLNLGMERSCRAESDSASATCSQQAQALKSSTPRSVSSLSVPAGNP